MEVSTDDEHDVEAPLECSRSRRTQPAKDEAPENPVEDLRWDPDLELLEGRVVGYPPQVQGPEEGACSPSASPRSACRSSPPAA